MNPQLKHNKNCNREGSKTISAPTPSLDSSLDSSLKQPLDSSLKQPLDFHLDGSLSLPLKQTTQHLNTLIKEIHMNGCKRDNKTCRFIPPGSCGIDCHGFDAHVIDRALLEIKLDDVTHVEVYGDNIQIFVLTNEGTDVWSVPSTKSLVFNHHRNSLEIG